MEPPRRSRGSGPLAPAEEFTAPRTSARREQAVNDVFAQGGCQCGAIRYQLTAPFLCKYVCHCTECRRQSASAFGISVIVARAAFRVTRGAPQFWSRPTDSGRRLDCAFCPLCGTRVWHRPRGDTQTISIKGGSLDDTVDLRDAIHIWTSRALPGVVIPAGAVTYPGEPDSTADCQTVRQSPDATCG